MPPAPEYPAIEPYPCEAVVCLSVEDTVELSTWIHEMDEVERAIEACNLVKREE